jgi:hypothetical protein
MLHPVSSFQGGSDGGCGCGNGSGDMHTVEVVEWIGGREGGGIDDGGGE